MATIVISSVGSGAGRDYATISAWITAKAGNFVTQDVIQKAELYDDSVFSEAVSLTGATTDDTRYWWIAPAAGCEHFGIPGAGVQITNSGHVLSIANDAIIEGIEIRDWGSSSGTTTYHGINITASKYITIKKCIIHDRTLVSGYGRGMGIYSPSWYYSNIQAYNNFIYNITSSESSRNSGIYGVTKVYNNTLVNCKIGITSDSGRVTANNNITQDCDDGFFGSFYGYSYNNLSDISSDAPGYNPVTASLTFVNAASENYHLAASDTAAINAGYDMSATFTDDIDGQTRASFDIGADEYIAPAISRYHMML